MAVLLYDFISAQPLLPILESAHKPDIEQMEVDGSFFVSERRNNFCLFDSISAKIYIIYSRNQTNRSIYLKQTNLNMKKKEKN